MSKLHSKKEFLGKLRNLINLPYQLKDFENAIKDFQNLYLLDQTRALQSASKNPLNHFGKKCFSQTDEDGITLEILKRIDSLNGGSYVELGVGDGMENNTLILAALGWKGVWIGAQDLLFDIKKTNAEKFQYLKEWITSENVVQLIKNGLERLKLEQPDVISLDLDGNDIYLVKKILQSGLTPKIFIVEYNAKFPPPIEFQIDYNPTHEWLGDDYFGASLTSYNTLLQKFNYRLVCCNSHTGSNAFFIHCSYEHFFEDVPVDLNDLYMGPRYFLYDHHGHPPSIVTVQKIMSSASKNK